MGFSPPVNAREQDVRPIKRLEPVGVVRTRLAIIDASAVGLGLQDFVLIRTNDYSAIWLKAFQKAVCDMPEIISAQNILADDLDYVLRGSGWLMCRPMTVSIHA